MRGAALPTRFFICRLCTALSMPGAYCTTEQNSRKVSNQGSWMSAFYQQPGAHAWLRMVSFFWP